MFRGVLRNYHTVLVVGAQNLQPSEWLRVAFLPRSMCALTSSIFPPPLRKEHEPTYLSARHLRACLNHPFVASPGQTYYTYIAPYLDSCCRALIFHIYSGYGRADNALDWTSTFGELNSSHVDDCSQPNLSLIANMHSL